MNNIDERRAVIIDCSAKWNRIEGFVISMILSLSPQVDMRTGQRGSKLMILFSACRPKFFTASVAPVLAGSAMGYAAAGVFEPVLFGLAVFAMMVLHAGANMTNDYFDHVSGNDWAHKFPTEFSGGRRFIQQGILSPRATLTEALIALAIGSAIGIVIVLLTGSVFILLAGVIGLLGGYFYTASPVRLGYRCVGEFVIAILFGLLPVYGAYYLQTKSFDAVVFLPGCLVGILIFLVILINEFPDAAADAAVNKKTLVVRFGVQTSITIYRIMLVTSYVVAIAALLVFPIMRFAGLLYLLTGPIALYAIKIATRENLTTPGHSLSNKLTIILHSAAAAALSTGFIIYALVSKGH